MSQCGASMSTMDHVFIYHICVLCVCTQCVGGWSVGWPAAPDRQTVPLFTRSSHHGRVPWRSLAIHTSLGLQATVCSLCSTGCSLSLLFAVYFLHTAAWWCSGSVGLVIERLLVQLPSSALPGNNLGQVVHTHVPLFIKQYNLVPARGRWCPAAGNVTVRLASHWPCVTDLVVYSPTGLTAIEREMCSTSRYMVHTDWEVMQFRIQIFQAWEVTKKRPNCCCMHLKPVYMFLAFTYVIIVYCRTHIGLLFRIVI